MCPLIVSNTLSISKDDDLASKNNILLADDSFDEFSEQNPVLDLSPDDIAIVLYTSGSTGKPKGVIQSHINMVHFIKRLSDSTGILVSDKIAYYLSVGYSAHALPLLAALLNGCGLSIFDVKYDNFFGFRKWLRESKITYIMMNPSYLRHLTASVEKGDMFPDLRVFLSG